jgi:hypothetical protein
MMVELSGDIDDAEKKRRAAGDKTALTSVSVV